MTRRPDVAVVGGGIIGHAIAHALARGKAGTVAVIDHGRLGGEASAAAAGLLPVAGRLPRSPRSADVARHALAMLPDFIAGLNERSGGTLRLERPGVLEVATSAAEIERLRERTVRACEQGFRAEVLDHVEVRRQAPELSPTVIGGAWFPDEAAIDPRCLVGDLRLANDRLGVQLRRARVDVVAATGAGVELRIGTERLAVGTAIVAAGWWSTALLAGLGVRLPVRPARGEMIAVRMSGGWGDGILTHGRTRVMRRDRDVCWIGTTLDYDSEATPTAPARARLRRELARLLPVHGDAPVLSHWCGVRPCSRIRRPIVDRVPGAERVLVAAGHHRSGFLLAPLTAARVASLLLGGAAPPAAAFSWGRR